MSAELRRTHIWHTIVSAAFSPHDARERATWLSCFTQAIHEYVPNSVVAHPRHVDGVFCDGKVGCPSLDFTCEYKIEPNRAQFDFYLSTLPTPSWHSQFGIESDTFTAGRRGMAAYREVPSQDEMDEVLRGLIAHPCSHLHFHHEPPMREFRVGIGLCKPFLFLFQLRFQLCIDATRREREMERLRAMFTIDWLTRGRTVSPQILFGLV